MPTKQIVARTHNRIKQQERGAQMNEKVSNEYKLLLDLVELASTANCCLSDRMQKVTSTHNSYGLEGSITVLISTTETESKQQNRVFPFRLVKTRIISVRVKLSLLQIEIDFPHFQEKVDEFEFEFSYL